MTYDELKKFARKHKVTVVYICICAERYYGTDLEYLLTEVRNKNVPDAIEWICENKKF